MMNEVDGMRHGRLFQRLGNAYRKERSVILREEDEGKCPISSEREGLRTLNFVHRRSTKVRISN